VIPQVQQCEDMNWNTFQSIINNSTIIEIASNGKNTTYQDRAQMGQYIYEKQGHQAVCVIFGLKL
jgi:hypothetical protein